jgi:hypothetical protein
MRVETFAAEKVSPKGMYILFMRTQSLMRLLVPGGQRAASAGGGGSVFAQAGASDSWSTLISRVFSVIVRIIIGQERRFHERASPLRPRAGGQ